jgi:hypothetical protein
MCQPIRSVSATDFYECQGNPWNHTADSGRGRATHMISNIKKNKADTKACHIVTGTAAISFSLGYNPRTTSIKRHWLPT